MFVFWSLATLMLGLALAAVLVPLLRRKPRAGPDSDEFRLAAYRQRLAEIEQEIAAGVLAPDEAQAVRLELERELLRAVPERNEATETDIGPARGTAVLLLFLLPFVALWLYLHLGQPGLITAPPQTQLDRATLEDMAHRIQARLKQSPEDPVGMRLLAQVQAALGRYEESAELLERVHVARPDDPEVLVELAQALGGAAEGSYIGRPLQLLERALELQPQQRLALWLAGSAAAESGDNARALHHWEQLLPLVDAPEAADAIRALIAKVRAETTVAAAPVPSRAEDRLAGETGPFRLRLQVELAPGFSAEQIADAVLFITARSTGGPPMPLVALRVPAADLPREVILDQSNIMIPGTQAAELSKLDITARISRSGLAERQAGDLIGETSGVLSSGDTVARVVIDRRLP